MPSLNDQSVANGAFVAVALSDGESAAALLSRCGSGLMVEEGSSSAGTQEILRSDALGVPSEGHVVRLRVHRRGRSALVTALAGDGMDLDGLSQILDRVLSGLPVSALTGQSRSSQGTAIEYEQAQASLPRDLFNDLMALGEGESEDVLVRVVAAISGLPCQGRVESVSPSVPWPCSPRLALSSIESGGEPMIRVLLSEALASNRARRELERHGPDIQGQLCSVTAIRDAATVKLLVRTIAGVGASRVLAVLTEVVSSWVEAPDTAVPASDLAAVLQGAQETEDHTDVLPGNDREQLLVDQVCRLLERPERAVSLRDNFFSLGGDSMTALQLVTAVRALGWQIEVRDVFISANLRALASRMRPATPEVAAAAPMSASGLDAETLNRLVSEE